MAEPKTARSRASVSKYLDGISDAKRQSDSREVLEMMAEVTGEEPAMWGTSIVGFGRYRYRYASGKEGEGFLTGFAARKQALTLYVMSGFRGSAKILQRLGPHKTGKSCLYLRSLDDVDRDVLRQLVARSVETMREKYPD